MNLHRLMKRVLFATVCLAVAAIACNKEIIPETGSDVRDEQTSAPGSEAGGPRTVTLSAVLPETKTTVDIATEKVTWDADDAIAVYNTAGTKFEFTVKDGAGTSNATFECTGFTGTIDDLAVYPYAWAEDTKNQIKIPLRIELSDKAPAVMASKIEGGDGSELHPLYFKSLMAIIEFTLQDVPAYARALKIHTSEGPKIRGDYTIKDSYDALEDKEAGSTSQYIYFPYGTAYGAEGSVKICAAIPVYEYTDLTISMLDGDEKTIEGTEKKIPNKAFTGISANSYIRMPVLTVKDMVTRKYIGVEGVKWAKGNLRAWKSGPQGEGWQTGWNIYDNQWESQYMLKNDTVGDDVSFKLTDKDSEDQYLYREGSLYTHWDYFSWGTLSRSSRVHNCAITSSTAGFDISRKVFRFRDSATKGDISTNADEVFGDERWGDVGTFQGDNSNLAGDLAFWASKGQYCMPTKDDLNKLFAEANYKKGSYTTADGKKINGFLFTSCAPWESRTKSTTDNTFTDADLESGLFLPKIGWRFSKTTDVSQYNATEIRKWNAWGPYWSSTYGDPEDGDATECAWNFFLATNSLKFEENYIPNTNHVGDTRLGSAIRPVWIPESERQ